MPPLPEGAAEAGNSAAKLIHADLEAQIAGLLANLHGLEFSSLGRACAHLSECDESRAHNETFTLFAVS